MRVWLAQVSLAGALLQGRVTPWELPALAAKHGFDGIEWLDRLLPSFEPSDLARLGQACASAGLGPGGLSLSIQHQATPRRLALQTQRACNLLEACAELGVEYVRVGLGGGGLTLNGLLEDLSALRPRARQMTDPLGALGRLAYRLGTGLGLTRYKAHAHRPPPASKHEHAMAVQAVSPLAQRAEELGLRLGVENHWGLSGRPSDLLKFVYNLPGHGVGVCLDLDNFYKDQDSLAGVAAFAPSANHVHYKTYGPEPAREALRLGYKLKLELIKDEGYAHAFSIEYEGPEPSLAGAVQASRVLRDLWRGLG